MHAHVPSLSGILPSMHLVENFRSRLDFADPGENEVLQFREVWRLDGQLAVSAESVGGGRGFGRSRVAFVCSIVCFWFLIDCD